MGIALKKKLPVPEWPSDGASHDATLLRMIRGEFLLSGFIFEAAGTRKTSGRNRGYDIQAFVRRPGGLRVVTISPGDPFLKEIEVIELVQQTMTNSATPANIVLFVDHRLNFRPAKLADLPHVQYTTADQLPSWIAAHFSPSLREANARLPRKQAKRVSVVKIKTNLDTIIVSAAVLELLIRSKINALKVDRPNSPERVREREATISDYEMLLAKVAELQNEIIKFKNAKTKASRVTKIATAFGKTIGDWWTKSHVRVLDRTSDATIVLSMTALGSLMNVTPNTAMVAATALMGGKSVAGVLKNMFKP